MSNLPENLVEIGSITGVHGVKGKLKALCLSYSVERFNSLKTAYLVSKSGRVVNVSHVLTQFLDNGKLILSFDEINTREAAQSFVGGSIAVDEDNLIDLPEDTYFHFQLIGMNVVDLEGIGLGVIRDIIETGVNDVYEILTPENKTFMIPAIAQVIKEVSLKNNKMVIEPLEGLLD